MAQPEVRQHLPLIVMTGHGDFFFPESTDYSGHSEILEFGPGVSMAQIDIPIIADNTHEQLESFTVEIKLLNQSGIKIKSSRSMARVDVIDDDSKSLII